MSLLILGLLVFLGMHSLRMIAPSWRDAGIAAVGEGPWRGLYSLISLAGLMAIILGWGDAVAWATVFYEPARWIKHLALLLMLFSFVSASVSVFPAGRLKPLLKHPLLASVKIWAFAHLLANGDSAAFILFGSFLAWAVIKRISLNRRDAPVAQPGPVLWDIAAVVAGLMLYWLFVQTLHLWLFNVTPLA